MSFPRKALIIAIALVAFLAFTRAGAAQEGGLLDIEPVTERAGTVSAAAAPVTGGVQQVAETTTEPVQQSAVPVTEPVQQIAEPITAAAPEPFITTAAEASAPVREAAPSVAEPLNANELTQPVATAGQDVALGENEPVALASDTTQAVIGTVAETTTSTSQVISNAAAPVTSEPQALGDAVPSGDQPAVALPPTGEGGVLATETLEQGVASLNTSLELSQEAGVGLVQPTAQHLGVAANLIFEMSQPVATIMIAGPGYLAEPLPKTPRILTASLAQPVVPVQPMPGPILGLATVVQPLAAADAVEAATLPISEAVAPLSEILPAVVALPAPLISSALDPVPQIAMPLTASALPPVAPLLDAPAPIMAITPVLLAPATELVPTVIEPVGMPVNDLLPSMVMPLAETVAAGATEPVVPMVEVAVAPLVSVLPPALAPLDLVTRPLLELAGSTVDPVLTPVVGFTTPVLEPVMATVPPLVEFVAPILEPVAPLLEPPRPIVEPIAPILETMPLIIGPLSPITEPPTQIVGPLTPIVEPVVPSPVVELLTPILAPMEPTRPPGASPLPILQPVILPRLASGVALPPGPVQSPSIEPANRELGNAVEAAARLPTMALLPLAQGTVSSALPEFSPISGSSTGAVAVVMPPDSPHDVRSERTQSAASIPGAIPLPSASTSFASSNSGASSPFVAITALLIAVVFVARRAREQIYLRIPSPNFQTIPVPPG